MSDDKYNRSERCNEILNRIGFLRRLIAKAWRENGGGRGEQEARTAIEATSVVEASAPVLAEGDVGPRAPVGEEGDP